MTTTCTVENLFQTLRRSQLLDANQLNEVKLELLPDMQAPEELTHYLIEMEWLTDYQAKQLLEGNDKDMVLGPYEVMELVGEGGLCQVFRAWDRSRGRIVALKVVHAELREKREVREQLRQEMTVLGRLDHAAFIKSRERNWDESCYYFAMELAEGIDLHRLLKQVGRLPAGQACDYVRQAALGLQYAYEQGLVHRDIKPANLLAPFNGKHLRILDIGLARLEWNFGEFAASPTPSSLTTLMGTPDYVAPEQALNSQQADTRADIYSLGCTLYHLLTGQPPFPGKSLTKKLLDHQQTPAPSVREAVPDLPPALAAVVLKMMAKAPGERYQTPAGVAVALASFARGGEARVSLDQFRPPRRSIQSRPRRAKTLRPLAAPPAPLKPGSRPQVPTLSAARPSHDPALVERRASMRRAGNPLPVLLVLADPNADPLSGWVLNRSAAGLGILLEEPLEIGHVLQIRPTTATAATAGVKARVIHCTAHRASWCVGFPFVQAPTSIELRQFG